MNPPPKSCLRGRKAVHRAEDQYERMIKTPIPRLVTSLFIPTVAANLITVIYNTADTYFVSQIDKSATAAVGAVYAVMAGSAWVRGA